MSPKGEKVICFCMAEMALTFNEAKGIWYYRCSKWPKCKGSHGCHQGSLKPLGIPGDAATKQWRKMAHDDFDLLWRGEGAKFSRELAYKWLAQQMKREEVHIGELFIDDCKLVIELSKGKLNATKTKA